jgi:hypothetical protein
VSTCAAHDPPGNAIVSGRAPSVGFPALMAAAEELVPLVEQDAAEAERLCRQTDRVVAAPRETGHLFAHLFFHHLDGRDRAAALPRASTTPRALVQGGSHSRQAFPSRA